MWKKFVKFLKWAVANENNDNNKKKKENVSAVIKSAQDKKETAQKNWRKNTVWEKPKRARTAKGRYKGDDKSTPDINEAWEGGKAPKKSGRSAKHKK
jgi:uncharacterized membrane protein